MTFKHGACRGEESLHLRARYGVSRYVSLRVGDSEAFLLARARSVAVCHRAALVARSPQIAAMYTKRVWAGEAVRVWRWPRLATGDCAAMDPGPLAPSHAEALERWRACAAAPGSVSGGAPLTGASDICSGKDTDSMPTDAKAGVIAEITEKLKRARAAVLLQTEGLTVAEMSDMRRKLSTSGIEMQVVKNTLLRIAAEQAQYHDLTSVLTGQTTIAMSYEDEVAPAKSVTDYLRTARTGKPAVVKAGILERGPITAQQVDALAKTPPRAQLHAEVVGAIHGPLNQTYGVINAPLRDMINVLEARIRQIGEPSAA